MSELPKNWSISRIGEVADINPRSQKDELDDDTLASFVPMKCVEAESGRFSPPENKKVGDVKKGYTPMRDGDVIFAKVTPCMENGKAAVVRGLTNGIGFGSTEFYSLRPKDNLVPEFLFYYIIQQRFRHEAERHMTGAVGLRRVPKSFIEEHDIPLPPLPEQRRIVARIEELFSRLDAGVTALRHAKAQLQRYRKSVLAAAVTGQLTLAWREQHRDTEPAEELLERILKQRRAQWNGRGKYKEPVALELSDEDPKPATWTTTNLDSATTILGDGLHGTPEYDPEGEFYFINGNNLSNGRIIFKDSTKRVSESEYRKHSKPLTENSIFVSINGTLGNTAFYSGEKVILGKSACFFNLSSALSKHYVRTVLQTPRFLNYLHKTATGSTIKNVPLQAMRNFSFGIPPIAEQHQIVDEVEARTTAIDHLEAELDRQITRSNRLRQSTLASAFLGRL